MIRTRLIRWFRWSAVAVASVSSSILAPTLLIGLDALMKRDADAIYLFAMRTAEPVALVAAAAVTFLGARWCVAPGPRAADEGSAIGALSAVAMFAAALWVNDVDGWTIAAAALLPLAGFAGGGRALMHERRRAALHSRRASAALPPPLPDLATSPRRGTNAPVRHY